MLFFLLLLTLFGAFGTETLRESEKRKVAWCPNEVTHHEILRKVEAVKEKWLLGARDRS